MKKYMTKDHALNAYIVGCLLIANIGFIYMLWATILLAIQLVTIGDNVFELAVDILSYILILTFTLPIMFWLGLCKTVTKYSRVFSVILSLITTLIVVYFLVGLAQNAMGYTCDGLLGGFMTQCSIGTVLLFTIDTSSLVIIVPVALLSCIGIYLELNAMDHSAKKKKTKKKTKKKS